MINSQGFICLHGLTFHSIGDLLKIATNVEGVLVEFEYAIVGYATKKEFLAHCIEVGVDMEHMSFCLESQIKTIYYHWCHTD